MNSRENERLARNKAAFQSRDRGASSASEPIATFSIDDLIEAVKEHDSTHLPSVVVNPDGTPKVVFHGTTTGGLTLSEAGRDPELEDLAAEPVAKLPSKTEAARCEIERRAIQQLPQSLPTTAAPQIQQ